MAFPEALKFLLLLSNFIGILLDEVNARAINDIMSIATTRNTLILVSFVLLLDAMLHLHQFVVFFDLMCETSDKVLLIDLVSYGIVFGFSHASVKTG